MSWALLLPVLLATQTPATPSRRDLRVGLFIGEPIGLTAHAPVLERLALHGELGYSSARRIGWLGAVDLTCWLPEVLAPPAADADLAFWFGLGLRLASGRAEGADSLGLRLPLGISWVSRSSPTELFVQIVPGLGLTPERRGSIEGGVGVRLGL